MRWRESMLFVKAEGVDTLVELGTDAGEVEHTLHTIGFHPSICRETAEWAVRDPGREAGLPTAS